MRRLRVALLACLLSVFAGPLLAQDYSGSFAAPLPQGGQIAVVLRQDAQGRVTGTMSGNAQFQITAQVRNGQIAGYAVAPGGRLYLEGQLQGASLMLALAEVGPDGQPQAQTARTVTLTRAGAGAGMGMAQGQAGAPPMMGAQPPMGGPVAGAGPVARGQRGANADPYAGTFSNGEVTITLTRQGQVYGGVATYQGAQFPLQAQPMGDRISGVYQVQGQALPFQAQVQGDVMVLATNDGTFQLQRSSGAMAGGAMPGAAGAMQPGAGGAGGAGGVASTPQDQQLAQFLTRNAWCSFTYNQNTGTSATERYVFRPDGTGSQGSGRETYSSGYGGTVAGQSQGGQPFRWRVQSGMLVVSADGVNWQPQQLQVTRNSSDSPIITSGGKEFAVCN